MAVNLAELIDALPVVESDDAEIVPALPLQEFETRPLPVGALKRLSLLGGLQAKVAVAYTLHWIRGWFQSADTRERDLAETHFQAAVKLLDSMGYLRGAVMKVGQTLANFPDVVPDGLVQTLEQLHFQAPPMHFSLLREMVINELGDEPENLFADFEESAFAAASLGQVHRARLKTGQLVAVKIQYPGIASTIRTDFRNLLPLMLPARLTADWQNFKEQVDFLRRSIEQETDYLREARTQMQIRRLFFEEDGIVVPRVYPELSTERILTMDYVGGDHLDAFLARQPSQQQRNAYAQKLLLANTRILYQGRINNVDVHPGNYLFLPDGRIGLIDFGCVVHYEGDAMWDLLHRIHRAMVTGHETYIRDVMTEWQRLTDEPRDAEHIRLSTEFAKWSWKPYYSGAPFDYGSREYLQIGIDLMAEMVKKRCTRSHPSNLMVFRWQVGWWMLMYRLGAVLNTKPIIDAEVGATGWDRSAYTESFR